MSRVKLLGILAALLLAACQQSESVPAAPTPTIETMSEAEAEGEMLEPEGFIRQVHDPVMAFENGTYTIFHTGTQIPIICSQDMLTWEFCGRVFERNPPWTRDINPELVAMWAPDISFFNDRWHLYYAVSSFGSQNSAIGLATNKTLDPNNPDYEWVDQGEVLRSRPGDPWNAIDANLVLDDDGEPWLTWGSFWHGIWMGKIDKTTGMMESDRSEYVHLADRSAGPDGTPAIEAPFIVERNGKWYLFVSFDQCCQGANSTYNVRVGRSDDLSGPYVDRDGVPLLEGGGTLILSAYDRWKGPGHNGILIQDDTYWMVYHAYDSKQNGIPKLRIESLSWDSEGWPSLPSQTANDE